MIQLAVPRMNTTLNHCHVEQIYSHSSTNEIDVLLVAFLLQQSSQSFPLVGIQAVHLLQELIHDDSLAELCQSATSLTVSCKLVYFCFIIIIFYTYTSFKTCNFSQFRILKSIHLFY